MPRPSGPAHWALAVLVLLGCSDSSSDSGCSSSSSAQACDIDTMATVCGDRITIRCVDGEAPEAEGQCERAIEQDEEAIYCCTSDAAEAAGGAPPAEGQQLPSSNPSFELEAARSTPKSPRGS